MFGCVSIESDRQIDIKKNSYGDFFRLEIIFDFLLIVVIGSEIMITPFDDSRLVLLSNFFVIKM